MRQMNLVSRTIVRTAVAACLMTIAGPGAAAGTADPSGTWLTEDGRARVRLERCGSKQEEICGFIVWMKDPLDANGKPQKDHNNPDIEKRSRPLLGHQMMLGLKLSPAGHFDGQVYNAENGKFYAISLWRETTDRLKVKGCMLAFLCATQSWTQTVNALPGQLVGMTGDPTGPRADEEWAQATRQRPAISVRANK
jgi:uncharacterized protein (DUF2147 family)